MLESPFDNVVVLKASYFIKKRLQERCIPLNIVNFLRTPISKNSCKQLLLYIMSPETRKMRNGKCKI